MSSGSIDIGSFDGEIPVVGSISPMEQFSEEEVQCARDGVNLEDGQSQLSHRLLRATMDDIRRQILLAMRAQRLAMTVENARAVYRQMKADRNGHHST